MLVKSTMLSMEAARTEASYLFDGASAALSLDVAVSADADEALMDSHVVGRLSE